jgi:predicted  nucleic acid-binding Zn-ribbon protein
MDKAQLLIEIIKLQTEINLINEALKTLRNDIDNNNLEIEKAQGRYNILKDLIKKL